MPAQVDEQMISLSVLYASGGWRLSAHAGQRNQGETHYRQLPCGSAPAGDHSVFWVKHSVRDADLYLAFASTEGRMRAAPDHLIARLVLAAITPAWRQLRRGVTESVR